MHRTTILLLGILVACVARAAEDRSGEETPRNGPCLRSERFFLGVEPIVWTSRPLLGKGAPVPAIPVLPEGRLSMRLTRIPPLEPIFQPRVTRLSRLDCAWKGAGAGMRLGLFAGLLAQELGAAGDERTPWVYAGAAAAAGALLGGTIGAGDSRWSAGIEWEPRSTGAGRD